MSTPSFEVFDVRTLERYLEDGTITRDQYDTFLASLEDCADNAEQSSIQMQMHRRARNLHSADAEEEEN